MAKGVSNLTQVISEMIDLQTRKHDELELGTIQSDMSLKLDKFNIPIQSSEYLICKSLTLNNILVAGDRVLVAWVNNGVDPVIIDVVVMI